MTFFECDDVRMNRDIINDLKLSPVSYGIVTVNVSNIHSVLSGRVTYANVRIREALHCYQSSVRSLEEC